MNLDGLIDVNIREWVEVARSNPILYRDRQCTEILLSAIALAPTLSRTLVLKGGTLMTLVFKSARSTVDIDFSAIAEPAGFDETLTEELDALFSKVAIKLGYLDLICRVQSIEKKPRRDGFEKMRFPALVVRIGTARRGSGEEKRLSERKSSRVLEVEISFNDEVYRSQDISLTEIGGAVRAFTVHEVVAEKLRALLQQETRNRFRRQDIFDISYLIENFPFSDNDRRIVYETLLQKCGTRDIVPTVESFSNPEVRRRAAADWETLALEVGDLPNFDDEYERVVAFFRSLPWR
jgi:predicted nucleotidyltransferase component of viral defense system